MREYQRGRPQPMVAPFELSMEQGVAKYLAWQRTNRLAPRTLLRPGSHDVRAALLPFWLFSTQAHVRFTGVVGAHEKGALHWVDAGWQDAPPQRRSMQVYAAFNFRRDFARAVSSEVLLPKLQLLSQEAAAAVLGTAGDSAAAPALHLPTMRQAMAWELMVQAVREQELALARQWLKEQHATSHVRDVRVSLHFSHRAARLAFLPAFHLSYTYGETFNAHGERVPEHFEALISGAAEGGVAGPRHYSAARAAMGTGSALALGALGASAVAAPLVGMDPWSLVNIESGFAFFVGCSMAGALAVESRRLRQEEAELEKIVGMGLGPLDVGTQEQEVRGSVATPALTMNAQSLRSAAEWRRWEEAGKEHWDEGQRARWAEALFQGQHRRRTERARVHRRLVEEQARLQAEEQREERRRRRWGHAGHHHAFRHGHAQHEHMFAGGRGGGLRSDFLGYYRLLGLDAAHGPSGEDIKRAFRVAALRCHPDRVRGGGEAERAAARERFQALSRAYQVLRDPERRRQYDRGEIEVGQM
eukprot:scaffold14.g1330.t1